MQHRLAELRERRAAGEGGFTLIELLVVVVIIGILIAIAIPVYLNYQKGAKDKSAASDLRNAVAVLEQCNSDNSAYPGALAAGAGGLTAGTGGTACSQIVNLSSGTVTNYAFTAGPPQTYILTDWNTGGTPKVYCYNSSKGGSINSVANTGTAAAPAGTC